MQHILYLDFIDSASLLKGVVGSDGVGTPALEKAMAGQELSYKDGLQLMNEENLFLLGAGLLIIFANI